MRQKWREGMAHRSNAGYTLVELAIAVSLSGAVLGGVVAFGTTLWAEQRADAFSQNMVQLVQNVNAMFPGSAAYDKLNVANAIQLGVFSDEQINAAASVNHLYGQPITLGGLAGAGFNNQAWGLHYARLPANACVAILQYAIKLADAVAIVADPSGTTLSAFDDWKNKVSWVGGSVSGFDAYQPIKRNRTDVPGAAALISACDGITGNTTGTGQGRAFGLALVLRKL